MNGMEVGRARLLLARWMGGGIFMVLAVGGLAFAIWNVVTGYPLESLLGFGCFAMFGWFAIRIIFSRLRVDDEGLHWRLGLGSAGSLPWSCVAGVRITSRHTPTGGGIELFSAHIDTEHGESVLVARGTAFQPWKYDELEEFARVVHERTVDS